MVAAEPEGVSERLGNPAKVIRAVGAADDGGTRASLLGLIGGEFASNGGLDLENAEEFRRNLSNVRVLGSGARGHGCVVVGVVRHGFECRALIMPIVEIGR